MRFSEQMGSWSLVVTLTAFIEPAFAHYAITGVKTGINAVTGARPARRNILDLQKDAPSWSLYIQALVKMQQTPEKDLLSWFQVAGIHGMPFTSWDGYPQNPDAQIIGYCTHGSVLFPTWHRPYMALIEQILASHAQTIAKTYNSATYQAAADNFRIPYWDFSSIPTMPSFLNTATVTINSPSGQKTISNPLLTYNFQRFPLDPTQFPKDTDSSADNKLSTFSHTVRLPNQNGESSPESANSNLQNHPFMKNTYNVFVKAKDFYTMATTATGSASFEAVHNDAHFEIGGRTWGHMYSFSYSAYDPIFWLLHTNVDRLFAMWQAINPDVYMLPETDNTGTFTIPIGTIDTEDSALTPFTAADGQTAYTSASSRYLKTFGYSYPEVQDWISRTPAELKANVTAQINALYNPGGTTLRKAKRSNSHSLQRRSSGLGDDQTRAWSVAAKVLNTAIGEPFVVSVFLGASPLDLDQWSSAANLVGSMHVAKPEAQGEVDVNYEFQLNEALENAGVNFEDVTASVSYLKANLKWGVQKIADNTVVPNDKVAGLVIRVEDDIVDLPREITSLPMYIKNTPHPEITTGKAGGA